MKEIYKSTIVQILNLIQLLPTNKLSYNLQYEGKCNILNKNEPRFGVVTHIFAVLVFIVRFPFRNSPFCY